jgi:BlaR1 peptidase M56
MSDLLRFVLESGICLTFFYVVYWLFLKNETYFSLNRFYLVSALAFSFIIPGLRVTSPFRIVHVSSGAVSLMPASDVSAPSFGWAGILPALYAAGVFLFLARLVFHLIKLWCVVRRRGWRHYRDCKVVFVDREFAPFSFLNFVFLNEGAVSPDDLEKILAHERVHIRQGHSLDVLLMELAITLQWFNPFVWPYKKSLQETHEYLADDGVIAQGFSAVRYKLLVFEQHVGAQLFEFANNFKQSQIKRRLTMMSKIKSGNAAKLKLLFVLPIALFLVLAFAEPRLVRSAGPSVVAPVLQETPGQSQEEVKKERVVQAEHDLQMLIEKEKILREKLSAAEDPDAQKELRKNLEAVLIKQQELHAKLDHRKEPPVFPPEDELKAEFKKLQDSELKIREGLSQTDDPEKQAQLKQKLEQVMVKQAEIKTMLAVEGAKTEPTIEELKKEYQKLDQKAADVRAKLAETQDAQQKAELEDLLKKIAMKQEQIKIEAEKIKASPEQKKN